MLLAKALVVLAAVFALLALIAGYIRYQALDNDTVRDTAGQMIEDETIRDQIAASLVDQLYANVDVSAALQERLPEQQQYLAGPAAAGLRELSDRAAQRLLERPRPQQLWVESIARTHEQLIRALKDEFAIVQTKEGFIVVNLQPLIDQLGERIQVLGNLADRLPEGSGQVKIMEADQLETAQDLTELLDKVARVIWFVPLLLWAAALWLARGRRRAMLLSIAVSMVIVGLLVLLVRRLAGRYVVDNLVQSESVRPAAKDAWNILTDLLAQGAWTLIGMAVVAFVGIWLVGGSRPATAARRALAPYLAQPAIAFGAAAALLLLLVWWGPTAQTQRIQFVILGAVLLAIGVEALRRAVAAEPAPVAAAEPPPAGNGRLDELERLGRLRDQGLLTDAELAEEKRRVLGAGEAA
jgi:hypothetical protein